MVGAGRAGGARVRALEEHPRARLVALVRREGAPRIEDVLADPGVDALIVCTPNHSHSELARAGLASDRHVAVEFPLAPGPREARELFETAKAHGRVLHVEHIELLSPGQEVQRGRAATLARPAGGELHFSADSGGWIGDPDRAGSPALRALARLHRLVDLFGDAEVRSAELEGGERRYRLRVELGFSAGGHTALVEERAPGLDRATTWNIRCERGELRDPEAGPPGGLFRRDLDCFVGRVLDDASSYVSEERVLSLLGLVERIDGLC